MIKRVFSIPVGFFFIALFSVIISAFSLYGQSIRLDESQSIWVATKSVREVIVVMSQDVHPPLYNLLLHFWLQLFGTDVVFARTLSFIFFLLTLFTTYKMAREASNETVGFVTVTLFALSPFVLWFSNETRMYTLFTLATTLNSIFFLRIIRSEGNGSKLPYLLTAIFGLYTHYFFFFVLFTQFIFLILKFRLLIPKYLWLMFLAGIAFLPWVLFVVKNGLAASSQPVIPAPTAFNIFQTFASFLFGFQNPVIQGILISMWPLIMIFVLLVFTNRPRVNHAREIDYFLLLTFLPVVLIFLISLIRPIFLSRYLIFILPGLAFLLAWALESFPAGLSRIFTVGLLVVMTGLLLVQNFSVNTPVKEDYKGVSAYLEETAHPSDIIAVSAPFTIYPLEYTYTGHTKIVTVPLWDRYISGPTPAFSMDGLQSQLADYSSVYDRLFLILSYDQGYEARIRNYMDTNYKLLENKIFPSGIDLRVYKLRYS